MIATRSRNGRRLFLAGRPSERPAERLPFERVTPPGRVLLGHRVLAGAYDVVTRTITHTGRQATWGTWSPAALLAE
ncbi:hypothetical protein ADK74_14365 [Streptomyces decoyicus]|nr:hypothetical protein ADK74_14365 [Streptomyces decoyicus]